MQYIIIVKNRCNPVYKRDTGDSLHFYIILRYGKTV